MLSVKKFMKKNLSGLLYLLMFLACMMQNFSGYKYFSLPRDGFSHSRCTVETYFVGGLVFSSSRISQCFSGWRLK